MSNEVMLAGLLDQAIATLANAKTAADILDASGRARIAFETAKAAAKLKNAHDTVTTACHRVMADALQIEVKAKCRLADEYEAAQERGEVQKHGGQLGQLLAAKKDVHKENIPPSLKDIGLDRQQIHRARQVRNAEKAAPGVIKKTLEAVLQSGKTPRHADIKRAVKETLERAKGDMQSKKPRPTPKPTPKHEKIIDLGDQGLPAKDIAAETEICTRQVHQVLLRERIKREAQVEVQLDPSTLPKSTQDRLEAFKRSYQKQLDNSFDARVRQGIQDAVSDTVLPFYKEKEDLYDAVCKAHKGLITREDFRQVLACLHPDSRRSVSDEKLAYVFDLIKKREFLLVGPKEMPLPGGTLPGTYDELMERKRQMQKDKRNGASTPGGF